MSIPNLLNLKRENYCQYSVTIFEKAMYSLRERLSQQLKIYQFFSMAFCNHRRNIYNLKLDLKMDEKKRFQDIRKPLQDRGFEIEKLIGKGAFGEVMLVRESKPFSYEVKTDKKYAVKTINKMHVKKKPFLQKYIDQEIEIMRKLDHPNIVKHQNSFSTNDFIIIIMEYCDMGNLLTHQSKLPGKTFSLSQSVQILVEVMKGLKIIHQKNFIHRDIKSQNVLLKKVPKSNNIGYDIQYKIADFGFARPIGGIGAKTHCGTEKYMAPQIISNAYYGISVDLWALGVLFFFMLFAQYPFKGHDMKADILRRCNPTFNVQAVVTKRQKLKQINSDVEDFFRKLFVVDPKKRITFANIIHHPLFFEYTKQFEQSVLFYKQLEHNQQYVKDQVDNDDGDDNVMQPEDQSRSVLLKKKVMNHQLKPIQRQLEQISFEIKKIIYLKQCATELYDNYSSYLTYAQRLAARFYLLKAFLFYAQPLSQSLQAKKMPQCLSDANIDPNVWDKCTKTDEYRGFCNKLQEEQLKTQFLFEDTYALIQDVIQHMPIKNFQKGYTPVVNEKSFDELKFSYRSTTSHIFKSIHENKRIDLHLRNKIKMRLFCCHMINRIFNRRQIPNNFPHFINWLNSKSIKYQHTFDFIYFKKWILEETQDNLQKNISLLHKKFF